MLYPAPRSDEDETEDTGPCGGFPVSDKRTPVSMTSFPVALEMGHDRNVVQMLLGLGNDPGNNFNITLEKTFQQQGEGDFCLPNVQVPTGLNVVDGTNGTLQVVTDGEGGGGLYIVSPTSLFASVADINQCADITFTSTAPPQPSSCTNGTGITAMPLAGNINANESNAEGQPQEGGSASASMSSSPTETATGSSSSSSNQAMMLTAGWGVLGGAVIGAIALI